MKQHIPAPLKKATRRVLAILSNELNYMETHLTDHCNLNCKGCTHYCPIATPRYTDPRQYECDVRRLRQLFRSIRKVRLMGGEPLLHPDPVPFLTITRDAFPKADIRFVTNGILLPHVQSGFWEACRHTSAAIDLTLYPPLEHRVGDLRALCEANGVCLHVSKVEAFHAHHNLRGDSDRQKAFDSCQRKYRCPFLQNGRLYVCAMAALIHYFNSRFGYQMPAVAGINIHSPDASARDILRRLAIPIVTCKWCSYDFVQFPWSKSSKMPEDWDATTHRRMAEQSAQRDAVTRAR